MRTYCPNDIFLFSQIPYLCGQTRASVPTLWYYLRMQKALFTPLSIRRGDESEASPPLGGGWEGFPIEGVCPYFVALFQI